MASTNEDIDQQYHDMMSKFTEEEQKHICLLYFAQLYLDIGDYKSAERCIRSHLSVGNNSALAHKISAQCYEYSGFKESALREFKYSLCLDPSQPELYLKVCELYADGDVKIDAIEKEGAKIWHDRVGAQFPDHPVIQKLEKRLVAISDESILLGEMKEKPHDAAMHFKLLNFYIDNGRFPEAYDLAFRQKLCFTANLPWYRSCVQLCKSYRNQVPPSLTDEFYGNYLFAFERSLALSVQDVKMLGAGIQECLKLLVSFDDLLVEADHYLEHCSKSLEIIFKHMLCQLFSHTAIILYRKAKCEEANWSDMMELIIPLLKLCTASDYDIRSDRAPEGALEQVVKFCILNTTNRIQQSGYILIALLKQSQKHSPEHLSHEIKEFCITTRWKERICEIIYNSAKYEHYSNTSLLCGVEISAQFPNLTPENAAEDIGEFLSACQTLYPSSLHHLVWIGVHYLHISDRDSICDVVLPVNFTVAFPGSSQFPPILSSLNDENLSQIDMDAFLFACVYCAKSSFDHQISQYKPLPADVSEKLGSPEQNLWWEYANQFVNQTIAEEHCNQARATIQQGIEQIRLVGHHVLPLHLLVLLGRTFANKAIAESDRIRASELESRSLLYWKAAVPELEKILQSESHLTPTTPMFVYQENIITTADAATLIAEGKSFMEMVSCMEKDCSSSKTSNENIEDPRPDVSASVSQAAQTEHSVDDAPLKTLLDRITEIMVKLGTISDKQELLSSNQRQLSETVSVLSKKIDDVSTIPNDCSSDPFSASKQPAVTSTVQSSAPALVENKKGPTLFGSSENGSDDLSNLRENVDDSAIAKVTTGEKRLQVLFREQCKLFKVLFPESTWKRYAVGEIELLGDLKNGASRLMMRNNEAREICCNQLLTPQHKLEALCNCDRSWYWTGEDFSEALVRDEVLYVRFQTVELANAFKEAFDFAKTLLALSASDIASSTNSADTEAPA